MEAEAEILLGLTFSSQVSLSGEVLDRPDRPVSSFFRIPEFRNGTVTQE